MVLPSVFNFVLMLKQTQGSLEISQTLARYIYAQDSAFRILLEAQHCDNYWLLWYYAHNLSRRALIACNLRLIFFLTQDIFLCSNGQSRFLSVSGALDECNKSISG